MHQQTFEQTLHEILTISQYPNDKIRFIAEFEGLNAIEAILRVYKRLSPETQEFIKAHQDDSEAIVAKIPVELYSEALTDVRLEALQNYLKAILPILSQTQKEKINRLVVTF